MTEPRVRETKEGANKTSRGQRGERGVSRMRVPQIHKILRSLKLLQPLLCNNLIKRSLFVHGMPPIMVASRVVLASTRMIRQLFQSLR